MAYWAKAKQEDIAKVVIERFQKYQMEMDRSGMRSRIQALYNAYYTFNEEGGFRVTKSEDGSISYMGVNHYKNLLQRIANLTTEAKLGFAPRATNSDSQSQIQADFSRGLLDYYNEEKDMSGILRDAVNQSLFKFDAFIYAPWDFYLGKDSQAPIDHLGNLDPRRQAKREGDQAFYVLGPHDVARSLGIKDSSWYVIRQKVNKWDMAARYPDHAEAIENSSATYDPRFDLMTIFNFLRGQQDIDEDLTYQYTLIHKPTDACPKGRITVIIADCAVSDSVFYYKTCPVVRMTPGEIYDTVCGDTPASSLLPLQQGVDALSTALLTNNLNNALSNVWSPTAIDIVALSNGMQNVVSPTKPEALQLTQSSPESYKLLDNLISNEQALSGMNSAARGQPDGNLKTASGQALAIAQAIQFVSDIQKNYATAAGQVGTIVIHNLQKFCSTPRIAYLGGQSRASYAKEFTSNDVANIDRVIVDLGSPLVQTMQGRYGLVSDWIAQGTIKPQEALTFMRTGELDSGSEASFRNKLLIREENERIRKGERVAAQITDNPIDHILEHRELGSDPAVRDNPQAMQALADHLNEHLMYYQSMNPDLAAIYGLPPLPSMMAPAPAPAADGSAPPVDEAGNPLTPPEGPGSIQGQPLPNLPSGTPPQTQADYVQGMQNITNQ